MTESEPRQEARVQSIDRAAALMRCFLVAPERQLADLASETGLTKSTAHRLLAALAANGLIQRVGVNGYALGPLVWQLGGNMSTAKLQLLAEPYMVIIRDRFNETVGLHELLPDQRHRAVIHQVESSQALRRHYTDIGMPVSLAYGAPSKAILAFLPRAVRSMTLAEPIRPISPDAPSDVAGVEAELSVIRDRGWADVQGQRTAGIRAVGAPIFGPTGAAVGALSVSGPIVRMTDEMVAGIGPFVRDEATRLSLELGSTKDAIARATAAAAS